MAGIAKGVGANAQAGISTNGHALNPRHLEKGIIIPAAEASFRGMCAPLTGTQTAKAGGNSIATAEWSATEYWLGSASGRQVPEATVPATSGVPGYIPSSFNASANAASDSGCLPAV
jgi:hypothetical protein